MGILSYIKGIGSNTLYYPGCLTEGVLSQEFENYKEIFNKLGVDFILLPNKPCCGLPVLNAGYKKDARKLAKKNLELFKKHSIKKIITNCPSCYHTFKEIYPTLLRDWDIEVEHATITILNALQKKRIRFKGNDEDREPITYHDPCHLGRYSEIYDEPRQVIELLGGKIIEMRHNKRTAMCCGGGGGVRANFPELAKKIAKKRSEEVPKIATKIISPCGLCFANIKSADERSTEFSTFVLGKLRGLRR
ncbi:(Fe-S)-binding protein [archaeon]|jgi:Fe-S oxidoreductase|nr:(Fe-S)-binding protein [archaeon]MBT3577225.1 (Fe-S)-binding protein [archaeon]MBT6820234.1 (Fe-S)-binding protein [archaeon]MBT6956735.1 (Fe-S)-binding protein [archaeon]MBT7025438.1 (Fe-S)-binding protein [archaeon]